MDRLSSDDSLPVRNWQVLNVTTSGTINTPHVFTTTSTNVMRAILICPSTNLAAVTFAPANTNNTTLISIAAGSSYTLDASPGSSYDLSQLFSSSSAISQELQILYQPQ